MTSSLSNDYNTKDGSSSSSVISSFCLRGHQGPVLCLDVQQPHSPDVLMLVSGSEDCTVRLWNVPLGLPLTNTDVEADPIIIRRSNNYNIQNSDISCTLCITCPGEVTAVSFAPNQAKQQHDNDSNDLPVRTTVVLATTDDATDCSRIHGVDLQKRTSLTASLDEVGYEIALECQEEVNQLAFSSPVTAATTATSAKRTKKKGKSKPAQKQKVSNDVHGNDSYKAFLVAVDDAGHIRVTQQWQPEQQATQHDHQATTPMVLTHPAQSLAASMITCAAFAPSNSKGSLLLATGGTDCITSLWDLGRKNNHNSHKSTSTAHSWLVDHLVHQPTETGTNQVCNPPMVHTLSWSPLGRLLAAGLGDGSVSIWQVTASRWIQVARLDDAHAGAVASVAFASERLLWTIGNDGMLVAWDVGTAVAGDQYPRPRLAAGLMGTLPLAEEEEGIPSPPQTLLAIPHGKKPNWMTCCSISNGDMMLFVADTSNDITGYRVPTR